MTLKRNATLKLYIQWAIGCKDITKKRRNLFLARKGILLYKTLCKRAKRAAYTQNKIVTKGFWLRPHRWLCHEFILEDEVLYKIRKVRKKYYLLIFSLYTNELDFCLSKPGYAKIYVYSSIAPIVLNFNGFRRKRATLVSCPFLPRFLKGKCAEKSSKVVTFLPNRKTFLWKPPSCIEGGTCDIPARFTHF